jgi:hypothetical protein
MYFTASMQAYDALTEVLWVVTVREWTGSDTEEPDRVVLRLTGQSRGEGLENPTRWLRTVLEEVRESL